MTSDVRADSSLTGDALARLMEWADQHNADPNHQPKPMTSA